MEIIKSLAFQSPMIIASLVFVTAAILKAGKEKGAILILLGAIGLCLLTFAIPIIYSGIMPKVIENMQPLQISVIYSRLQMITNIFWAAAIVLISIGTFLRSPAVRQPYFGLR